MIHGREKEEGYRRKDNHSRNKFCKMSKEDLIQNKCIVIKKMDSGIRYLGFSQNG